MLPQETCQDHFSVLPSSCGDVGLEFTSLCREVAARGRIAIGPIGESDRDTDQEGV